MAKKRNPIAFDFYKFKGCDLYRKFVKPLPDGTPVMSCFICDDHRYKNFQLYFVKTESNEEIWSLGKWGGTEPMGVWFKFKNGKRAKKIALIEKNGYELIAPRLRVEKDSGAG